MTEHAGQDAAPPTPLEMALNAAAAVLRYADFQAADPLQAHIARAGQQGHDAAELAGNMALISIAVDLHRLLIVAEGGQNDSAPSGGPC